MKFLKYFAKNRKLIKFSLNMMYKLQGLLFIFSSVILYGSAINISNKYCPNNSKFFYFNICKSLEIIKKPVYIVSEGLISIQKIKENGTISGMVSAPAHRIEAKKRFEELDPGFNFYYQSGSRANAGFLLLSNSDKFNSGKPNIELWDLNLQKVVKRWDLIKSYKELMKLGKYEGNYFLHPLILKNNSIVFNTHVSGGGYLVKLDSNGQIKAINENYIFRHSINIDKSGLIYACIENKDNGREGFAILDQDLKVINTFYIDDIYTKAKLEARLFSNKSDDPIHINDVQPLLSKGNLKSDIVFISLRSTSSILGFNLKEKRILWMLDGFSSQQHDVDILDDDPFTISIFDNNISNINGSSNNKISIFSNLGKFNIIKKKDKILNIFIPNTISFINSKIEIEEIDFKGLHKKYRPKTFNSGLSEYNPIENTFIVEESNFGRIFEYDYITGRRLWEYKNSLDNEIFWRASWSRFYQENPLINPQSI